MNLRFTVVAPERTGARAEVLVDAPSGTPLSAVSKQLAATVTSTTGAFEFRCAGEPVDPLHLLGFPPLLEGTVLAVHPSPSHRDDGARAESPRPVLLELHVLSGPDAGGIHPLDQGRHTIGRSGAAAIRISDADLSRVHAEVRVDGDQFTVADAGSTNGTWLGDTRITAHGSSVQVGELIRLGTSTVAIRQPNRPPAAATLDGEGHRTINRRPHLAEERARVSISFPTPPAQLAPRRLPWPAMVLPLVIAVPLAFIWRQPSFLLFAAMTPLLAIGQHLMDRRSGRREAAEQLSQHAEADAAQARALARAVALDAEHLERTRPDLAELGVTARTPTDDLWRRPRDSLDFLLLRVGRGTEEAQVSAVRPRTHPGSPEPGPEPVIHPEVPIALELRQVGVLGICGDRPAVLGVARSLVGQIAVLHSPQDVQLEVMVADDRQRREWRWVTRLPHHAATSAAPAAGTGTRERCRVLVLDGAQQLRHRHPGLAAALGYAHTTRIGAQPQLRAAGPPASPGAESILVICLDDTEQALPMECGAVLTLDPSPAGSDPSRTALLRQGRARPRSFAPDLAGPRWAERLSRSLAPLRDATPTTEQGLPDAVRLLEALTEVEHVRATDPADLARHWRRGSRRTPAALLGISRSGPFRLDLRRDGPHVLVGGTTGSGKSELLQSLVTALAVDSAPDAISFLLVDYKGGAAFRECAELPHVGAVITDLDHHLARRALTSLVAELRRRERLLNSVGAVDVDAYAAARSDRSGHDLPALPRLVVVVDEFRVLSEELPEFVSGLVRTATVGRSLGVHLVLATQRPAGVVSAEISANVNLRIALRVRDGGDSLDLIEAPDAALLPPQFPGRALARSAAGPLTSFQTARVCGRPTSQPMAPVVRRDDPADLITGAGPVVKDVSSAPAADPGLDVRRSSGSGDDAARDPSDLARICRAAHSAMGRLGLSTATPPWRPPLPEQLAYHAPSFRDSHETPWPGLTLGLADLPQQQSQVSASWLLDEAHLAIAGGPRSGRTTAVRTLAHAIADAPESAGELHAYILDGANALADLEGLPNVESVIRADDLERADRLLRRVRSEIEVRRPAAGTEGPADQERGRVILLIDGWETLLAAWAALDHGVMLDDLTALLREGVSIGVHVAITGGRALLTGSVSSLLGERMVLRFADPADALLAGVPTALTRIEQKAGRAIWTGARFAGATEVQIALPPPAHALPPAHAPRRDGWTIPELPRQLSYAQLQAVRNVPDEHYLGQDREIDSSRSTPGGRRVGPGDEAAPNRSPRRVIVGIGGDDASPMALDLDESPVTLVLGPARSGRSTALRCIAEGLRQLTEPAILLRSGPLERRAPSEPRTGAVPVTGTGPTNEISLRLPGALEQLSAALSQHPGGVVLVDDVSLLQDLGDGPADAIGRLLSAQVSDHGGAVVLASSVPEVLAAYRGPLTMARGSRSGLLLGPPSAADGEVFALRLRRRPVGPPGRALLISAGRAHCLQVALPPDSSVVHATAAGQLLAQG